MQWATCEVGNNLKNNLPEAQEARKVVGEPYVCSVARAALPPLLQRKARRRPARLRTEHQEYAFRSDQVVERQAKAQFMQPVLTGPPC